MKNSFLILFLSIFLTLPIALSASDGGATSVAAPELSADSLRRWSLAECQDFAVQNSPRARIQGYTNRKYNQDVIAAVGAITPSVSAGMGADWGFGRSIDPQTNTYDNLSNFNNRYGVDAQMLIFSGLRAVNTLRAARLAQLRGTQELQKAKDDIALETLQAFVDVVYYTEAVSLAEQQLTESRRNLYSTQRQVELGLKSVPDVAQFEAEVAGFEFTLVRQTNALATSILQLKTVMNFPIDEPLQIAPEIPVHTALAAENTLPYALGGTSSATSSGTPSDTPSGTISLASTAAAIFADIRDNLPAAQIADYQLRDSELSLAITRGSYYPSVSAYGSLGSNYFKNLTASEPTTRFRDQIRNNYGSSVGLSVSIPIFNGLWQRTRVNRARNDVRIAEQTHSETLRKIQTEIEQAVMDVEGYAKEWAQAQRKVEATETAHRANQRKFDEGLVSALELQNSTNLLLLSRIEELNARLQYHIKCWLLDFYKSYGY